MFCLQALRCNLDIFTSHSKAQSLPLTLPPTQRPANYYVHLEFTEQRARLDVLEPVRLGDAAVGDFAGVEVQAAEEVGVALEGVGMPWSARSSR